MKTKADFEIHFWSLADKKSGSECWIWKAGTNAKGYGRVRHSGGPKLAHRVAWELTNGPIEEGALVCHRCDNPPCVNPEHLFLGTHKENTYDMLSKGRCTSKGLPGSGNGFSKITEKDALKIRELAAGGMRYKAIASLYGMSKSSIEGIANRRSWNHV